MSCPRCMEASGLCAECEAYLCAAPIEDPEARVRFACFVSVASLRCLLGLDFDKYITTERLDYVRNAPPFELVFTAAPPAETFYVKEFKIE